MVERGKVIGVTDHERRQIDLLCLVLVLCLVTLLCLLSRPFVALRSLRWCAQCRRMQRCPECRQIAADKQQPTYAESCGPAGPAVSPPCGVAHATLLPSAVSWVLVVKTDL